MCLFGCYACRFCFRFWPGAVMLARPIEDRKKRQIYVAGAVIVNAVLALTVLIWTPDGVLTLLRFSDTMQIALQIDGAGRVFGIWCRFCGR